MWIPRIWQESITAAARNFPVVLVTGPRQVGKTALLRRMFPKAGYVSFDDPALARAAESDPRGFLASHRTPVIMDEVQYVPGLFRHLKRVVDGRAQNGSYLLTGSQSLPLMAGVTESLAGRCGIVEMNTLSLAEVKQVRRATEDLDVAVRGGYPALYSGSFDRAAEFYASYVATYLERDVRAIKQIGDLRDFDRFMRACAARTAQLLSYSDLAKDVGIAVNTAKAWLSVLRASGQVWLLEPYHRNSGQRLIKSPKLHFMDTGLVCHLLGLRDLEDLSRSPIAGAIWETFVFGQVVRALNASHDRAPLWFYHRISGPEVDLVIERGGRFVLAECKMVEEPDSGARRGIDAMRKHYGAHAVEQAFVVCRTPHAHDIAPGVRAVSVSDLVSAIVRPRHPPRRR